MTINRDAILSVINNRFNSQDQSLSIKGMPCIQFGLDYLPKSLPYSAPELDDTDDDSSVSSYSVISSTTSTAKGVSFAAPLVTEIRYRPRTLKKHKAKLYYTVQETARFRQEYREERCRLKQEEDELDISSTSSNLGEPGSDNKSSGDSHGVLDTSHATTDSNNDHRIYKVVVKHKNTLETFIDKEMDLTRSSSLPGKFKTANDDFFDNDSFWNGEITWY